jgi:dienelactone hydrolase
MMATANKPSEIVGGTTMRRTLAQLLRVLLLVAGATFGHGGIAAAANVAILMPGSLGIFPGDFLVRNEERIKRAGIRTIMTTSPASAAAAIAQEAAQGRRAVLVGMSSGAGDVALALAAGARPAGVVFVSGIHSRVIATLGTPEKLPPTLVVHHSRDGCKFTLPSSAAEFVAWSRGKARLQWINTSGPPGPNPCGARDAHGFFRQDGPAVSAIISFIRSR